MENKVYRTVVLYGDKEFKSDWIDYSKEDYEADGKLILQLSNNTNSERYLEFNNNNKRYFFNGEILNKSIIYLEINED